MNEPTTRNPYSELSTDFFLLIDALADAGGDEQREKVIRHYWPRLSKLDRGVALTGPGGLTEPELHVLRRIILGPQ